MNNWCYTTLFFLVFLGLTSCRIEEAKSVNNEKLIILSDYLEPKDTLIFQVFGQKENIQIEIINISAEKMIGLIRNDGYNVDGDIIMVKSMYDVHRLTQQSIFHTIDFKNDLREENQKYISTSYNYFGFGFDPFIYFHKKRSGTSMYNELIERDFINLLNKKQRTVFFSPILKKMPRVKSKKWVKRAIDHSMSDLSILDSNRSVNVLMTYSDYKTNQYNLKRKLNAMTFPNSTKSGTFYNLRTMAIVKQSKRYPTAKRFIEFYIKPKSNRKLTKKLSLIPIENDQSEFREYSVGQDDLIQYFTLTERILTLLNR